MTIPDLPPLISSDGHLEVRPERWSPRMPAKHREHAPPRPVLHCQGTQ